MPTILSGVRKILSGNSRRSKAKSAPLKLEKATDSESFQLQSQQPSQDQPAAAATANSSSYSQTSAAGPGEVSRDGSAHSKPDVNNGFPRVAGQAFHKLLTAPADVAPRPTEAEMQSVLLQGQEASSQGYSAPATDPSHGRFVPQEKLRTAASLADGLVIAEQQCEVGPPPGGRGHQRCIDARSAESDNWNHQKSSPSGRRRSSKPKDYQLVGDLEGFADPPSGPTYHDSPIRRHESRHSTKLQTATPNHKKRSSARSHAAAVNRRELAEREAEQKFTPSDLWVAQHAASRRQVQGGHLKDSAIDYHHNLKDRALGLRLGNSHREKGAPEEASSTARQRKLHTVAGGESESFLPMISTFAPDVNSRAYLESDSWHSSTAPQSTCENSSYNSMSTTVSAPLFPHAYHWQEPETEVEEVWRAGASSGGSSKWPIHAAQRQRSLSPPRAPHTLPAELFRTRSDYGTLMLTGDLAPPEDLLGTLSPCIAHDSPGDRLPVQEAADSFFGGEQFPDMQRFSRSAVPPSPASKLSKLATQPQPSADILLQKSHARLASLPVTQAVPSASRLDPALDAQPPRNSQKHTEASELDRHIENQSQAIERHTSRRVEIGQLERGPYQPGRAEQGYRRRHHRRREDLAGGAPHRDLEALSSRVPSDHVDSRRGQSSAHSKPKQALEAGSRGLREVPLSYYLNGREAEEGQGAISPPPTSPIPRTTFDAARAAAARAELQELRAYQRQILAGDPRSRQKPHKHESNVERLEHQPPSRRSGSERSHPQGSSKFVERSPCGDCEIYTPSAREEPLRRGTRASTSRDVFIHSDISEAAAERQTSATITQPRHSHGHSSISTSTCMDPQNEELTELRGLVSFLQSKLAGLENELHTTREQQTLAKAQRVGAFDEIVDLRSRLNDSESAKAKLSTLVDELRGGLERTVAEKSAEVEEAQSALEAAQAEAMQQEELADLAKGELAEFQRRMVAEVDHARREALKQAASCNGETVKRLEDEISKLRAAAARATQERDSLCKMVASSNEKQADLESTIDSLQADLEIVLEEAATLSGTEMRLTKENSRLERAAEEAAGAHETAIAALKHDMQVQVDSLQRAAETAKKRAETLAIENERLKAALEEAQEEVRKWEAKEAELASRADQLYGGLVDESADMDTDAQSRDLKALTKKAADLEKGILEAAISASRAAEEKAEHEAVATDLRTKLEKANGEIARLGQVEALAEEALQALEVQTRETDRLRSCITALENERLQAQ